MNLGQTKIWVGVGAFVMTGAVAITPLTNATEVSISKGLPAEHSVASGMSRHTIGLTIAAGGEGDEGGTPAKPTQGGGSTAKPPTTYTPAAQGGEASTKFTDKISGSQLVSALRSGGYIVFFRHAQTEKDYADQISAKMGDCSTQRMLSEAGWKQAKAIGEGFQKLKIPVGTVYSSEYCRAWQTADLAFGKHQASAALNFEKAEEYTPAQIQKMKTSIMPFLTAMPASGTNTVIVGHDDVFKSATGIYPEPQGVAYILKPNGKGGFDLLSRVTADGWGKMTP